ncbi:Nn.00g049780.m01.CDS01 [Neocucurbitaria sp. VM-36]
MVPAQTGITTVDMRKSGGRNGLRKALRRWKDGLMKDKSPSRISTPAPTPQPLASASHNPATAPAASPSSPSPPTSSLPSESLALFKPTTQTHIHSPLDKRNKTSNSSSPASTLRRPYLGSRRNTAPADYFSFVTSGAVVTEEGKGNEDKSARRSSRLMLSFSKRSSVQPQTATALTTTATVQPLVVSPAPSTPSPTGHENRRQTCQYTTTDQTEVLAKSNEGDLAGVVEVIK